MLLATLLPQECIAAITRDDVAVSRDRYVISGHCRNAFLGPESHEERESRQKRSQEELLQILQMVKKNEISIEEAIARSEEGGKIRHNGSFWGKKRILQMCPQDAFFSHRLVLPTDRDIRPHIASIVHWMRCVLADRRHKKTFKGTFFRKRLNIAMMYLPNMVNEMENPLPRADRIEMLPYPNKQGTETSNSPSNQQYNFNVYKFRYRWQKRILQIDFYTQMIFNIEKGTLKKQFPFEQVKSCQDNDGLKFVISFHGHQDYELEAACAEDKQTVSTKLV
ncbi:unnamed protein product [Ranitomeya imitator]|uniref:Uncharacterized protein n=1 Tax=Ranitomeya imitator TaxID=111125 RepID=A0ABN9MA41_9NEOB|nr:unnamed protein product [Ranitomeya imitator]